MKIYSNIIVASHKFFDNFLRNCFLFLIQDKLIALKYAGKQYIKLVFPRQLILNMLRIRHYKKLFLCIHISGIHCNKNNDNNNNNDTNNNLTSSK